MGARGGRFLAKQRTGTGAGVLSSTTYSTCCGAGGLGSGWFYWRRRGDVLSSISPYSEVGGSKPSNVSTSRSEKPELEGVNMYRNAPRSGTLPVLSPSSVDRNTIKFVKVWVCAISGLQSGVIARYTGWTLRYFRVLKPGVIACTKYLSCVFSGFTTGLIAQNKSTRFLNARCMIREVLT